MTEKPTYEELEKKVAELEKEALKLRRMEIMLRESEEKYRVLFQSALIGACLTEPGGKILDINECAARSLGYDRPEELIGKNILLFYKNPDERDTILSKILSGNIYIYELELVRNDGTNVIVSTYASLMEFNGKKVILTSGEDISKRKKAEQTLQESEERHRSIFENTGTATVIFGEDMTISMMNAEFEKLSAYSKEEVEGKMKWTEFVAEEDLKRMKEYHAQRSKAGSKAPTEYEFQFVDRQGNKKDIFIKVDMIPGTLSRIASLMDITSRKRAEKALQESEEKYRTLFEESRDAIFISSNKGILIDINQSALELIGYRREDAIGIDVRKLYANPDNRSMLQQEISRNGFVKDYETKFRKKDGREIDCLVTATIRRTKDGDIEGIQGNVRDISEKKELEAQFLRAQKMEAIGTLAGGIAHDFNNILMGIQGRTSLMLMNTLSTHFHFEHLKGIEEYVRSAADLTKQLLSFAKGGRYEAKPTDINELVKKQNHMFGRTKKEISIQGKYEKNLWAAEVDQGQIEQVLLNLCVNAWQAMPGGGKLFLQTENVVLEENNFMAYQVQPGRYVRISITDTGEGMDETTQQRIFEPFFTTKEMGRGTGLGLASVYGIIKNHKGFINVNSYKDIGTTFYIYLPASEKGIMREKELPKELVRGTETLLLVDDEEVIIEVSTQLLKKIGYDVLVARSGEEAIDVYSENIDRIDMIILDMIMPDMKGGLVYDALKGINPHVKVLLFSGYSVNGQATEILNRGCNGFIQKPFNTKDISQKIRDILDQEGF
ncbi:MAG: PAS domain S-box protein [Thermodesulfobacteriota bacterium]|nr:PAS domain S-box protein [Thermodesulfobacteriota bacterium]